MVFLGIAYLTIIYIIILALLALVYTCVVKKELYFKKNIIKNIEDIGIGIIIITFLLIAIAGFVNIVSLICFQIIK